MERKFKSRHCKKLLAIIQKKSHSKKPQSTEQPSADGRLRSRPTFKSKPKEKRGNRLAEKCKRQLEFSKFRAMNEFIYTNPSKEGFKYMQNVERFEKYHDAYREIAHGWPVRPVDFIVTKIEETVGPDWEEKKWKIADLGCGNFPVIKHKLDKAEVASFDVVSTRKDVIAADIANVPLEDRSIDIAVFSLSLMATNIKDLICEANRILKNRGILMIAEVTSRFEDETIEKFLEKLKKLGFHLREKLFLPPNEFFVFFSFVKKKHVKPETYLDLPGIHLKSCMYKPR